MELASYELDIDFDNDGSFETAGDDISADLLSATVTRGFTSPLARVATVGRANFTLNNASKSYSPPLQATRLPRRPVRFRMTYNATTVVLFRGYLERIRPAPGVMRNRTVVLECVDAMALLDVHEGPIALLEQVTADDIISAVVSAVYTPPSTNYQVGVNTFPFSADRWSVTIEPWMPGQRMTKYSIETVASQKILEACVSDWGRFFISKAGAPTFYNRHQTPLDTSTELTLADDMIGMGYEKGVAEIYNQAEITSHPRAIGEAYEVLGRLSQSSATAIQASTSATFRLDFRDPSNQEIAVGGRNVLTPVATTDFTATKDLAGLGTDETASITPTMTAYGDHADITLANSKAYPIYVQFLQVRGIPVRVREPVTMIATDATSITAYQRRKLQLDAPLMNTEDEAKRLADYLLSVHKDPANVVTGLQLIGNQSNTFMAAVRDLEILDRVVLTESQTGLSAYAGFISSMTHTIMNQGDHVLTFDLETAFSVGGTPFRLDQGHLDGPEILIY